MKVRFSCGHTEEKLFHGPERVQERLAASFGKARICSSCQKEKKEVERELVRRKYSARFPELIGNSSVFGSDVRLKMYAAMTTDYSLNPTIIQQIISIPTNTRFWIANRNRTPEEILRLIYLDYPEECRLIIGDDTLLKECIEKGISIYWERYYGRPLEERCINMRIKRQLPFLRRYPKEMWQDVVAYVREHGEDNIPSPKDFL